jgi:hypothetical protein
MRLLKVLAVIMIFALSACSNTAEITLLGIGNSSKHVAINIEARADGASTANLDQTASEIDWESLTDQASDGELPVNLTMPVTQEAVKKAADVVSIVKDKVIPDVKPEQKTGQKPDVKTDVKTDVKNDDVAISDIPAPATKKTVRSAWYNGRTNGNRPTWYFNSKMAAYPNSFMLNVPGCKENLVVNNNGTRWEGSGYLVKASDVSGRGMAVLAPAACNHDEDINITY